jgi:hypothetical protein
MNDDPSALFESGDEVLEYFDAILVCPIMEYGTEVVDICCDRLRCEEIAASIVNTRLMFGILLCLLLCHECYPILQARRESLDTLSHSVWEILNCTLNVRVLLRKSNRDTTVRSSNVNERLYLIPRVVVQEHFGRFISSGK